MKTLKEIRIRMQDILDCDHNQAIMQMLKNKGFPCNDSTMNPKPKEGLKYFEFHDFKTDEIVVQWEGD